MKNLKIYLPSIFIFLLLNLFKLSATPKLKKNNSEEFFNLENSSVFFVNQDSIFQNNYKNLEVLYKKKDYGSALSEAFSLYNLTINSENKNDAFLISFFIAEVYNKTNKHKRALTFYKKSLSIINEINILDTNKQYFLNTKLANTYLNIGSSYQKLLLKDSAKIYYQKLDDLPKLNNEVLSFKANSYTNLSAIYEQDSVFDAAEMYANKAINIYQSINDKANQANGINNLGNIYLSENNYEKAKETYLKGIDLIKNDNSQQAVGFKANLYYNLAWAMRNLKEYQAYDYQELFYNIEDGRRDKEVNRMIEEVTASYNVENVKKEAESRLWLYGAISFIVILSLLYFLNFYKLRQKNLSLKLSQTQLLQNQNIEKLKSESQTRILNATIDGKESERKEIAETLHDSVSALLSSANLHLMATKSQFNGKAPIEIDKTQQIITEASQKIRDLSHTLVSSVLLKFGLNYAIKDLASKYSNSVINIEAEISGVRRYHQNFEIKIYNIIQEFINNILKHSKAKNADIKLYEQDNNICFKITDDGVGFDKTKISDKDGLGINQIDARIQMMNGDFLIESTIGKGTTVTIELPIIEKDSVNHVSPTQ